MNNKTYCDNPLLWEEICSSKPTPEDLYFHEIMMLIYVGYGKYYSNDNKTSTVWLYQMNVLYPNALIMSLIERGYVVEDTLYNTLTSRKDLVLQLLKTKGFIEQKKDQNIKMLFELYSEKELRELVPYRKYVLTEKGTVIAQKYSSMKDFTPYGKGNPLRRFYGKCDVKSPVNFYCVDIIYNSSDNKVYFKHALLNQTPIEELDLNKLYMLVPNDVSGTYADVYDKASIKAKDVKFRFFYNDKLVYQNKNIESIFVPSGNPKEIFFSKYNFKEKKRTYIKNPEGIPNRIIIDEIKYYDYVSFDFETNNTKLIEVLTEKIDLKSFISGYIANFTSGFLSEITKDERNSENYRISYSASNYLGEMISEHYLSSNYELSEINGFFSGNDKKNYIITIPNNDIDGLNFLWLLRSKGVIGQPICFENNIIDVLKKFAHLLCGNELKNVQSKILSEVIKDSQNFINVNLLPNEKKFIELNGNDVKKAAKTIISNFGIDWLDGHYIGYSKGIISLDDYERGLLKSKQMYNDALVLLQQKDIYIPKWKQEFQMFLLILSYYPDAFFQYHDDWLALQSLDVFIPSLNIAFEYQGKQHYEPVDFFGGEESFQETVERDLRKKEICDKEKIKLVYWKFTEEISIENLKIKLKDIGFELPEEKCLPNIIKNVSTKKQSKKKVGTDKQALKIYQYDKKLGLVGEYLTIAEASEVVGVGATSIGKALKGERFLAGGYFWYRGEQELSEMPSSWISYVENGPPQGTESKSVKRTNVSDENDVEIFSSITQAANSVQVGSDSIRNVLKKSGIYKGYRWELL